MNKTRFLFQFDIYLYVFTEDNLILQYIYILCNAGVRVVYMHHL